MPVNPTKVRLDVATACQLKCPTCPTAEGHVAKSLGTGFLKFEDFKNFLKLNPGIKAIEVSNWGEIFLNPELIEIIRYAYGKNVTLHCDTGANFNRVSDEVLEALVKYSFRSLTCSIDGASQETYAVYRRKGNFAEVLKNIRRLNEIKKKYNSKWPQLRWQFVIFGHNEHEIVQARKMAQDLGMRFWVKLSYGDFFTKEAFSPVKNKELVRKESGIGVADRSEFQRKYGQEYAQKTVCAQMWVEPAINVDGKILGCCLNYWGDFGNAFKNKTSDWFNMEKMEYARQMLRGKKHAREGIPCSSCAHYLSMTKSKNWLTLQEILFAKIVYKSRYWLQDHKYLSFLLRMLHILKPK